MKSLVRNPLFGAVALIGAYFLSWQCNSPAITSITRATIWGLVTSVLFVAVWCGVVLLHSNAKLLLWVSFLLTLNPFLIALLTTSGIDPYTDFLTNLLYPSAIYLTIPYLGFGWLSSPLIQVILGLQCLFFLILLVRSYKSHK